MIVSDGQVIPAQALAEISPNISNGYFYAQDNLGLSGRIASYGEMYRRQLWVYVVCRKIGVSAARLTVRVWDNSLDTGKVEAPNSPYARLLNRPNPNVSPYDLWRWTVTVREIYGEAYWYKLRDVRGQVIGLYPMHPSKVAVKRAESGEVTYLFTAGSYPGGILTASQGDVVEFLDFNPDGMMRGMSQLEPLRSTLLNEDAARRATQSFWQRGARPSVALTHPDTLSQGAQDRILAKWEDRHAGADLMGGTAILEEGMKPQILSLNMEEMQYIESRKLNREEVCAAADIPPPVVHILDHATYCLPSDAQVSTQQGPKAIIDVVPGDQVWAFDGSGLTLAPVAWSGKTGDLPLISVQTANRRLRATANHPVLVSRRPHIGGAGNRARYGAEEFTYVRMDALRVGDLIIAAHGQASGTKRSHAPNGREVTEFLMEFAGIMMGDGSIHAKRGIVAIAHADKASYIGHYLHIGSELFTQRNGAITWGRSGRSSRFTSITAARELVDLGFSGNARTKRIPGWVYECSELMRLAFLRGLIEADGSVDKKGRISFGLCNREMVQQVRDMMIGLGIPVTNVRESNVLVTLPNGAQIQSEMHMFTASDPGQNVFIGSWDGQDFERLTGGKPFNPAYYQYADRAGRVMQPPSGCQLSRVTKIETSDESVPVYDLSVPGSTSFVADGVVVHNSNITEQMRSMYRDTMAPRLEEYEATMALRLAPEFGSRYAASFALDEVLRGDFETRATAVQGLITNGVMKPSEARPMFDLPDAGLVADQLYGNAALVPLGTPAKRVTITEPVAPAASIGAAEDQADQPVDPAKPLTSTIPPLQLLPAKPKTSLAVRSIMSRLGRVATKDAARTKLVDEHVKALGAVFDQQRDEAKAGTFNAADWDDPLAQVLSVLSVATAQAIGERVAKDLGGSYSLADISEWLDSNVIGSAKAINATTAQEIQDQIDSLEADQIQSDAIDGLFDGQVAARRDQISLTRVAIVAGYAAHAVAAKSGAGTKTWNVNSKNPRPAHAALAGETVPIKDSFSNGMRWPGDSESGGVDETAGCTCTVDYLKG